MTSQSSHTKTSSVQNMECLFFLAFTAAISTAIFDVFGQPAGTVSTICLLCQQTKPQLESKEKKSKTATQLGLESKIPRKQSISQ